jgi:predicted dehydrogenase
MSSPAGTDATVRVLLADLTADPSSEERRTRYPAALREHSGFTLAAVSAADESDTAASIAAEYDIPLVDSSGGALDLSEYDLVSLSATVPGWVATALPALRSGTHVLLHDVAAASAGDLTAAAEAALDGGALLTPALRQRFQPNLRGARAALSTGRIGLPWNIQADYIVPREHNTEQADDTWIAQGAEAIDVVNSLIGLPVHRVHAVGGVEGPVVLLLDHAHGLTSTLVTGTRPLPPGQAPAAVAANTLHRYRFSGSHGVLLTDAAKPAALLDTAVGIRRFWDGPDTVAALVAELHSAITAGRPRELGPDAALHVLSVIASARESIRLGRPVTHPDVNSIQATEASA